MDQKFERYSSTLDALAHEGGDVWTGASVHLLREANQWSFTADFNSPPPSTRPSACP